MPDITQSAWGDCVAATAQLNGCTRRYYNTASRTADDLWTILRSKCLSHRTFNPMTAWTYRSGMHHPIMWITPRRMLSAPTATPCSAGLTAIANAGLFFATRGKYGGNCERA
jgi:hypothetical protein